MTPQQLIDVIVTHGLAVRQLPPLDDTVTTSTEVEVPCDREEYDAIKATMQQVPEQNRWRFDDESKRAFVDVTGALNYICNASHWMCMQIPHRGATVRWESRAVHMAPTLEESVQKFLDAHGLQPPSITTGMMPGYARTVVHEDLKRDSLCALRFKSNADGTPNLQLCSSVLGLIDFTATPEGVATLLRSYQLLTRVTRHSDPEQTSFIMQNREPVGT